MSFDLFDSMRKISTMMSMGQMPDRSGAFREEFDNIIVDTVIAFDTGIWETGISKSSGNAWTIVQQYNDKYEANEGHNKWVKIMKDDPKTRLKDVLMGEGFGEDDE